MAAVHPFPLAHEAARGAAAPLQARAHAANDPAPDPLLPTVFHEPWWLDSVAPGWHAAEVRHDGRVAARLPYAVTRRRGFKVSVMPMLAHVLGPAIDADVHAGKTGWLRRQAIVRELVAQLPRLAHFSQTCHPGTPDVLDFQSCGFESFVQFTAEVAPGREAALWSQLRDKTRNVIRRAQERCRVEDIDAQEFTRCYLRNLQLAGERSYFDPAVLPRLFDAAAARRQGRIVAARTPAGRVAAAVFYVWDRRRAWYFLSTRDPQCADNGAVPLLVWHGMHMAAERGMVFDFDGVAGEGNARFYSGFGAQFRPRFAVWRRSPAFAALEGAVALLRGRTRPNVFVAP